MYGIICAMTDKFTLRNLFTYWIKMWPVTLVLVILGGILGLVAASQLVQTYKSSANILVVNKSDNVMATDYAGVINSNLVMSKALENAGIGEGACVMSAANLGNVVTIIAECTGAEEQSKALVEGVISVFENEAKDIYGEDAISVVTLSGEINTIALLSRWDYVVNVAVATGAGLVASMVIGFIRFDYATSKHKKK